ncbi:MAG: hypothetical protein IJW50_08685 [Clostridia bacterium]|nr:hypothetical protein [Clostridia bacterium]
MKTKLCFFDDYYIAARPGTVRRRFQPKKLGEFYDGTDRLQTYTSFFYDHKAGKYRLYYEVPKSGAGTEVRELILAQADRVEDFTSGKAELLSITGLDENGIHGCSVMWDEKTGQYLLAGNFRANDRTARCMFTARSEDGISFFDMKQIYGDYSDTYNSLYYNRHTEEYVITMRAAVMDRRIAVMRSKDFEAWSQPEIILHPMSAQGEGMQYYALGVSEADGVFYGLLWRFMTDIGQADFSDMGGYMENDLYYSHDGIHFSPTGLSPVAQRPLPPEYGCSQLWLLNVCDTADGRTILCGGASRIAHGSSYPKDDKFCNTVFYEIPKDGFVAVEGFGKSSIVYTKPVLMESDDIFVNYNAARGEFAMAVLDADGGAIAGYTFDDCIPMCGCATDAPVAWREKESRESLVGKRVRFAFRLNSALLWSVSFNGKPYLKKVQNSFFDARSM